MNVIKLPTVPKSTPEAPSEALLWEFKFSCTCRNIMKVTVDDAIFKNIELFCKSCGASHKIKNPGFK